MILIRTRLDSDEATLEALQRAADEFVRAGVTFGPSDWLLADPLERRAILAARQREEVEKLLRMVTALRDPADLIPMLGETLDEGTRDRLLATQGANTAAELLARGGAP
jgi:hypothetical protein